MISSSADYISTSLSVNGDAVDYPEFDCGPFEGVEKRMIVQFIQAHLDSSPFLENGSLRSISSEQWQVMLNCAVCQILSSAKVESLDSADKSKGCTTYLLSESSLFVFDSYIILKTCGTTTPLLALPTLLGFITGPTSLSPAQIPEGCSGTKATGFKSDDAMSSASLTTTDSSTPVVGRLEASLSDEGLTPLSRSSSFSLIPSSPLTVMSHSEDLHREDLPINSSLMTTPDEFPTLEPQFVGPLMAESVSMPCLLQHEQSGEFSKENREKERINKVDTTCVAWMLFSHLTYCFPDKQKFPHRSHDEESDYLDAAFRDPSAVDSGTLRTSVQRDFFFYAYRNPRVNDQEPLLISELMMLNVEETCVDRFAGTGHGSNIEDVVLHRQSSIKALMSNAEASMAASALDQFWFSPCGYSCNAVMQKNGKSFFTTAHISPEKGSSYASLEASFPFAEIVGKGSGSLSAHDALTCFNPQNVHVVELYIGGATTPFLGGTRLLSEKWALVSKKQFRSCWLQLSHAEYKAES